MSESGGGNRERLHKFLARAGVASRRHAEQLISEGRVKVNNETITQLGSQVDPGKDMVTVDGKLITVSSERAYYVLFKPPGVVTTMEDPQGRPTVAQFVQGLGERVFPVGRLDYDAEGALLFTNDGDLAHKLTHPSFGVRRTYLAKVKGEPTEATLEKLRGGVRLEDGEAKPLSVSVKEQAEKNTWLQISVSEGRPHLIKRMFAAIGHPVVRLFRPSYAGVGVEGLQSGEIRALSADELDKLQRAATGELSEESSELRLPPRRHGRTGEIAAALLEAGTREVGQGGRRGFSAKPTKKAGGFKARGEGGGYGEKGPRREGGKFGERGPRRDGGKFGERAESGEGGELAEKGPRREGGSFGGPRREGGKFGERGPRREGGKFGERGPRREGGKFGERGPRREGGSFGGPRREGGKFGERGPRREGGSFGERGPRREGGSFGAKGPRREGGSFGTKGPRREGGSFGAKGPRREGGGFGERGPRREGGSFGAKGPRREGGGFGERGPRREGGSFGAKGPRREGGGFGERGPRREGGGFGERRPPRAGGRFGEAGAGGKFGERGPPRAGGRPSGKRFGEGPPRREGPPKRPGGGAGGRATKGWGKKPPRG